MTIQHHPSEEFVAAYATGSLDAGERIVVATHLLHCASCRRWARALEHVGGSLLENMPADALSPDAWRRVEARLGEFSPTERPRAPLGLSDVPGLPDFVRRIPAEDWIWVAPGLHKRRLKTPVDQKTRVFLLKSRAGMKLLPHTHTGVEMTCVLTGSFRHDDSRYEPGDFDLGDPGIEHNIEIGSEGECISLVAMRGELRLRGLLGRVVQPLISL